MHVSPFEFYWLSVAAWLWTRCLNITPACGFLDAFTSKDQNTTNQEYSNSFNRSDSYATSTTGGDSSLSLSFGSGGGSIDPIWLLIGVLFVAALIFIPRPK